MKKILLIIGLLLVPFSASAADDERFPSRPITIVTPTATGGFTDIAARILAEKMSEIIGTRVLVENVSGASGLIGATRVLRSKPDGYTLLLGNIGTHILSLELRKLTPEGRAAPSYDPYTAFAPVALVAKDYILVVTQKGVPTETLQAFAGFVRQKQGKATFGSSGIGGAPHVLCQRLIQLLNVEATHVPYRSTQTAMTDLAAGDIDFFCNVPGQARSFVAAGTVKALLYAGPTRSPMYAGVPTAREAGIPEFQIPLWNALFAPADTPGEIVLQINRAVRAVLNDPATRKRLTDFDSLAADPDEQTPDALGAILAQDAKQWPALIKEIGIQN